MWLKICFTLNIIFIFYCSPYRNHPPTCESPSKAETITSAGSSRQTTILGDFHIHNRVWLSDLFDASTVECEIEAFAVVNSLY